MRVRLPAQGEIETDNWNRSIKRAYGMRKVRRCESVWKKN